MKTLKNITVLLLSISLFTLSSCSSDDDGGSSGSASSGTITAKIDGTSFTSMSISSSATITNSGANLVIIGSNSSGKAINLTVNGYDGIGSYEISGSNIFVASASYSETDVSNPTNPSTELWQCPYEDSVLGEINISEETADNIKGTFNFMCKNTGGDNSVKNITEGSFNLEKQVL